MRIDFRIFSKTVINIIEALTEGQETHSVKSVEDALMGIIILDTLRNKSMKVGDIRYFDLGGKYTKRDIYDFDMVHKFIEMTCKDSGTFEIAFVNNNGGTDAVAMAPESTENKGFSKDFDLIMDKAQRLYGLREYLAKKEGIRHTDGESAKIDLIDLLNIILYFKDRMHISDSFKKTLEEFGMSYEKLKTLMTVEYTENKDHKYREDYGSELDENGMMRIIGIDLDPEIETMINKDLQKQREAADKILGILDMFKDGSVLKEKKLEWDDKKDKDKDMTKKAKKTGGHLFDGENDLFEKAGAEGKILSESQDQNLTGSPIPTLDQYGRNLNAAAKDNKIDPVIGREKEIDQLIDVLRCRKKTSAILIGEAGCGKTAVVEGLAKKLESGEVPECLKGKKVYSISTSDLTAGTMYRGQLEERLQNIINELKNCKNVILYIDEFHQATGEEKSTSIADILKPSLSRGEISVIASTTTREYKKFVEKDAALRRRFQKIIVEEPTKENTLEILKGLERAYSEHHKVNYSEDILKTCVDWADKYVYDRKFPDKAIDILDIAGSYAAKQGVSPEKEAIIKKWNKLKADKLKAVCEEIDLEKGSKLKKKEIEFIQKTGIENANPDVTMENVAAVISRFSNIPVDKILNPEMEKLRSMKQNLLEKIIGQDEAIKTATMSLSKSYLGLRDENKPIAALMFVGPTGVGKTMLCEEICNTIFGDPKALVRIDCGEYNQPHTVTKLIGAPASYVGYGEPGILDQIRERPNSLVLFDEIEKMHPDIINTLFLNILSTGMITMSNGVEVSFKNCIVVFTGNVGTKELELKGTGIGFGELNSDEKNERNNSIIRDALKKQFRPEFINRLTNITVFNELSHDDMVKIFDLELNKLKARLAAKNYTLTVTDDLKEFIIKKVDTKYGARDLSRGITTWVEDKICEYMLEKSCAGKSEFNLSLKKDDTVVKVK